MSARILYPIAIILTAFLIHVFLLYYFPGLSLPIVTFFLIVIFEGVKYLRKEAKFSYYYLLLLPIFFFSWIPVFRADEFVIFLAISSLFVLIPLYVFTTLKPTFFLAFTGLEAVEWVLKSVAAPFTQIEKILSKRESSKGRGINQAHMTKIFAGIAITLPIFVLVLALLASADEIFSDTVKSLLDIFSIEVFIKALVAIAISIFIWFVILGQIESNVFTKNRFVVKILDTISSDTIIPSILMYSLSLIYVVFVVIQFGYLFGGEDFTHEHNVVFSEYAIKGFWEMIVVTIINFLVLYAVQTRFSLKNNVSKLLLMPGIIVILFTSFVMLYSSHDRLSVYENGYGFSRDRLVPHLYLIFETMLLVLLAGNLFVQDTLRRKVLNIGTFLCVIIFLMGFSIFSMDKFIVRKNVEKYYANKEKSTLDLDVRYLSSNLGIEGIQTFMQLKKEGTLDDVYADLDTSSRTGTGSVSTCDSGCIDNSIISKMSDSESYLWGSGGWRSWNYQYAKTRVLFEEQYFDLDVLKNLEIEGFHFSKMDGFTSMAPIYVNENNERLMIEFNYVGKDNIDEAVNKKINGGYNTYKRCPQHDDKGDIFGCSIPPHSEIEFFTYGDFIIDLGYRTDASEEAKLKVHDALYEYGL